MNKIPGNTLHGDQQVDFKQPEAEGIFRLWYQLTSPPRPDDLASFEEREIFRRGRTGSQISIILYALLIISFPAAFAGSNSLLVAILVIDLIVLTAAMICNRMKKVSAAGIMVVLSFLASPTANILTTPGGLNTSVLPIFGLLVVPLMCAVSFLPPWWVFIVGAGNCIFTLYVLAFMPSTGELHEILRAAFPGIVTPIIICQAMVSAVAFIWVNGAIQSLKRADQAEEIARLKEIESARQQEQLAISKQIEEGIQQIITTMNQVVTRNDFNIRVPLKEENILWRAGKAINNMLQRLHGLRQSQEQLEKTNAVAPEFARCIREGKPVLLEDWTQTAFDQVIIEYNKHFPNSFGSLMRKPSNTDR